MHYAARSHNAATVSSVNHIVTLGTRRHRTCRMGDHLRLLGNQRHHCAEIESEFGDLRLRF